jgi:hypothetical protein
MRYCCDHSGWVYKNRHGNFPPLKDGRPWEGLTQLRKTLEKRGNLYDALKLLNVEVNFISGLEWYQDFRHVCDALASKGDAISLARTANAKLWAIRKLMARSSLEEAWVELTEMKEFYDQLVIKGQNVEYLNLSIRVAEFDLGQPQSFKERRDQYLKFADDAMDIKDFLMQRKCLQSALEFENPKALHTVLPSGPSPHHERLHNFEREETIRSPVRLISSFDSESPDIGFQTEPIPDTSIYKRILDFEWQEATRSTVHLASAICRPLSASMPISRVQDFCDQARRFDDQFPDFNFPRLKAILFRKAYAGLKMLYGQDSLPEIVDRRKRYYENAKHAEIFLPNLGVECDVVKKFDERPLSDWSWTSLDILLGWIRDAVKIGHISTEEALDNIGCAKQNPILPSVNTDQPDVLKSIKAKELAREFYGEKIPISPVKWDSRFDRIQEWLCGDKFAIPTETKLYLLDKMHYARELSYRKLCEGKTLGIFLHHRADLVLREQIS